METRAAILERAQARPLLIELDAQERAKVQSRRKTLASIKQSLQSSGVDYRRFFDAGELAEIEQMELEDKIAAASGQKH